MYIAPGQGQKTPWRQTFDVNRKHFSLPPFVASFKRNVFEFWFLYTFFNVFPHVYSPRAGADNHLWTKPCCQQKSLVTLPICCKFQNNIFEVWFLYIIFHVFIHVHSPGTEADNPLGSEFLCLHIPHVTLVICCKFLPLNHFLTDLPI